ncbi:MAG TPA: hypothetical protein VJQ56_15915 [Blastocatellia bacterium]|nr:hypothetical protein [Blastocatellia bacterium]
MKRHLSRYPAIGLLSALVFPVLLIGGFMAHARPAAPTAPQTPTIIVTPITPNFDVQDPTNLQEAAYFAWQEFIALTWPAPAQGPTNFPRGVPLASAPYGGAGPTGQVVFETFRHKVEVFPGGTGVNPNGYDPGKPDFGFSSIPNYQYDPQSTGFPTPAIPPVSGLKNPAIPPFNNLDEVTQISLNAMYAGIVDPHPTMGASSKTSQIEKILFQAKVNETHYAYVASNKFWGQDANPNLMTILSNSGNFVQTGDATTYPGPYVSLPSSDPANKKLGTIEIKMAWRRLNKNEDASKFYTARVRYYVGSVDSMGNPKIQGFVDSDQVGETWGLVALHIIQKTPNAPAFIYATFGHNNNIVDANGNPVEEPDGTTKPQYVNTEPFIPTLTITPPPDKPGTFQTETTTGSPVVNTNSPQLYYHNVTGKEVTTITPGGALYKGPITVNRRLYMIPPTITAANRAAQQAIAAANSKAVWLNYRLINVQARPIDIDSLQPADLPTYHLANEVVETNPSLQQFSGGLNVLNGKIFDYSNYIFPQPAGKDFNTFVVVDPKKPVINKYLMGGCMGCHGSQGQKAGGDFSVILANGRVPRPDIIQEDEAQAIIMRLKAMNYDAPLKPSPRTTKKK